ncbi:hypothetical protein JCM21900_001735 [Sporobolomyces salmonicolor]
MAVIPGQPLAPSAPGAALSPGPGTFVRGGQVYAARVGELVREGDVVSVKGKEDTQAIPEPNSIVIGTVSRITRQAATLSLLTVDGRPCRPDFAGVIRSQDVRQTAKDSVKMWSCFRPGDVVRAKVISLGDSRSYFLSTAANSLGVLFAVSGTTGEALEAVSWEEMRDPMDETYDFVILGTGLTECVLSGLLSVEGKKVLHMDRNDYYGAESASLNLTQLYKKFRNSEPPAELGRDRDYAVDLIPKFMMANGEMTRMLVHTDVTRYLEFKQIAGSYVFRDGRISKVPSTEMEAVRSPLMGLFEKRRAKKFFEWVQGYRHEDPATQQGVNLDKTTMAEVYYKFGLEAGTQDFIGHAMALHLDDGYVSRPARETFDRILLYTSSMARYGKSPYIYPLYGLGELPQGFARLSAIYGGTYMLDKPVEKIEYDAQGKFVGVTSGGETVKAAKVIGDPSYFVGPEGKGEGEEKVFLEGRVVRAICILRHPIPNTDDSDSVQLIIPQKQVGRKHDIYIAEVSSTHNVCAKDVYIAMVSTVVETADPEAELEPGLKLLGSIYDKFVEIAPIYSPASSGSRDNVFITRSYDATSHFETVCDDVKDVWLRAVGEPLVLKKRDDGAGIQEAQ